jgi:hypothetical protein
MCRARDRLVAERTALINQLRAVLMERGIVIPQGWRKLNHVLHSWGSAMTHHPQIHMIVPGVRARSVARASGGILAPGKGLCPARSAARLMGETPSLMPP